ncbi:DNA cytosine methyltransferase [Actinorhabdospora filicis]|uniref:DNA cytosine methyltransferase n=1 Tax=Actinorhabdospora filicis TaxID=1785913 RepID=UPI002555605A|nr:DNA cytosine methyltransferase [Actinorhabdospora filicis]
MDLFAGPGGLDVAARWLGIPVVGIEWDENACATREAANIKTKQGDVREFRPKHFADATVLTGGPPCQTYTVAGSGTGRKALDEVLRCVTLMAKGESVGKELSSQDDPRTGLVLEPLRWALEAHGAGDPYEAIVLEQVPTVLPVWNAMAGVLREIGYYTACGVLHTEEFGVPQTRRRAILIARLGVQPVLPEATHRRYYKGVARTEWRTEEERKRPPWKTMADAIDRSERFVVISNYGTGGDPKLRGRRTKDEPAATVTGKISRNRLVSANDDQIEYARFTNAEAGRLQTFPMDFPWKGSDVAQQIGNAIPPRLAAHVLGAALGIPLKVEAADALVATRWRHTIRRVRLDRRLSNGSRAHRRVAGESL